MDSPTERMPIACVHCAKAKAKCDKKVGHPFYPNTLQLHDPCMEPHGVGDKAETVLTRLMTRTAMTTWQEFD